MLHNHVRYEVMLYLPWEDVAAEDAKGCVWDLRDEAVATYHSGGHLQRYA